MLYFSPILGEGPHGHPLQSPAPSHFLDPFGGGSLVSTVRLHPLCSFGKVSVDSCCDALPILGEVTLSCPPTPFLGLLGVGELVSPRHYALPTIVCAPSPSLPSRCGALIFIRCTFLEGRGGCHHDGFAQSVTLPHPSFFWGGASSVPATRLHLCLC